MTAAAKRGNRGPMRLEHAVEALGKTALHEALGLDAPAVVRRSQDEKHGDYQLNGVLPLAKKLGKNPRELAALVAEKLQNPSIFSKVEVAGPGFINLKLTDSWLAEQLALLANDANDGIEQVAPDTIVVDFSGPNIAKQMHVGHLRSTILGDALVKILRAQGHKVLGDNHLGDWGTQFGLLIVGMRTFGDAEAMKKDPIVELERVYKLASEAKKDEVFANEARAELAKLQAGDPDNKKLWEQFVAVTRESLDVVYADLGVTFDYWLGESAYNDALPGVVATVKAAGIAREDNGALCVFFKELEDAPKDLAANEQPFIVQKSDGAFNYATTDIATVFHRSTVFQADRSIYVVDNRQSLHFKQLFEVAKRLGDRQKLTHVGFGSVLGPDGKPLKTRDASGKVITLKNLLDEATETAKKRLVEEELDLPADELDAVAKAVGIGAVKYADLRQNRLSDYTFDWDKMIAFRGNAGPYLQYAFARTQSIFRKAEVAPAEALKAPFVLAEPSERALALALLAYPDAVAGAAEHLEPHRICDHLYGLARAVASFYEECPVLKSEGATRASRLALVATAGKQLEAGLKLLGITPIARM